MNAPQPKACDRPFPIMVKVWGGREPHDFRYIRRSLPSLLASKLPRDARVIFIDDRSVDPRVPGLLADLAARYANVEVWTNHERLGPNRGQEYNFPRVVERFPEAPYYVLSDDDIIYHPGWLQRLVQVYHEATAAGLRGVFTALNYLKRPALRTVLLPTSDVLVKERQAALNWLLPRAIYEEVGPFQDTGAVAFDTDYCNRMAARDLHAYCLTPSYVQNIGYRGAYQASSSHRAPDYVGKIDWYLRGRDVWYALKNKGNTVARLVTGAARRLRALPKRG